jgi:hypothetical protein
VSSRLLALGLSSLSLVVTLAGCSDTASHSIGVVGNADVRTGLPATSFADGWAVTFEQFIVVVHHPALIEQTNDDPAWVRRLGVTVWDVAADPEPGETSFEIYAAGLRATTYDGFDFQIAPPSASGYAAEAGNVESDVVDAMVENDVAIRVVGTATMGGQTLAFDWSFDTDTLYRCAIDLELGAEEEGNSVIEIAGGRLFGNQLGDETPTFEFGPIAAADANADGTITLEELDAAALEGTGYDAAGQDVQDLGAFVRALSRSIGSVIDASSCEIVEPIVEG